MGQSVELEKLLQISETVSTGRALRCSPLCPRHTHPEGGPWAPARRVAGLPTDMQSRPNLGAYSGENRRSF